MVVEISDPTAVGESIEVIKQDVVKLESKPLRVRRVVVRLGSALVLFHSTNLAVRTRTRLHVDFEAYTAFGPQAIGTVNGLPVSPDRVLASMPGVEVEIVVAAGYESVVFLLPPNEIRNHLRVRHRKDEFRLCKSVDLLTPSPAAAHRLYRWGRRLTNLAARQPELFDVPQAQAAAQVELIEILLATLSSVIQVELTPQEVTRQRHSRIVQLVEDYAMSHISERIHVTDLCEAAGVSERNLEYCFKEVMGMTPMSYLTRLRLHRVRQALRAATHASTTVTKEALRWGFWHFGDFSRAYKACFGELPSDTLRRPPDAKESF
jgi:AraC-like DNA-binding protein